MKYVILTGIALVALFVLYIYAIRPLLVKIGWLSPLPAELQTISGRIYSFFRFSLTMVVGWITALGGFVLYIPQLLGDLFSDPDMKASVAQLFADWPKFVAGMFVIVGIFTVVARSRTAPKVSEMSKAELRKWAG